MFQNNLKIAWRNLLKSKLPTAINIIGLAIGIAGCLVVFQITHHELSVNKEVVDGERIYRVYTEYNGDFEGVNPGVPTGVASLMTDALSGAEVQSMIHTVAAKVEIPSPLGEGQRSLSKQEDIVLAGPSFFDLVQNYEWSVGSAYEALSEPNRVVLTEAKAKQYFGVADAGDAIGREVVYDDSVMVTVAGILRDPTFVSDFHFTDFISAASIPGSRWSSEFAANEWGGVSSSNQLFVKTGIGVTADEMAAQLRPLNERFNADAEEGDLPNVFKLQPLSDLHFNEALGTFDSGPATAHLPTLFGLMAIAGLLLLIAAVNFINLATVQATRRSKETGVRKVVGATRRELSAQYLTETALLAILALPVSLGLSEVAAKYFAEFLPAGLEMNVLAPRFLLFMAGTVVVVTLLAGLYPAFLMSSFRPAFALRNQTAGNSSTGLRKGLIAFQFVMAQAFIIGALIMGQQLQFVLEKDLGFDREAVVYFYLPWRSDMGERQLLKQELEKLPEVMTATLQNKPPMASGYQTTMLELGQGDELVKTETHFRSTDTNYLDVYGMELLAGRNLLPSDTINEFVVNEKLANHMGAATPADAIGMTVKYGNANVPIVGVVADFHVQSLHHVIPPLVITTNPQSAYSMALKVNHGAPMSATLEKCQTMCTKVFPGAELEYLFLDDRIASMYESEGRTAKLINMATGLVILISCLGLFGLAFFTVNARAKEISIRKILGASVGSVIGLLSKEVVLLVAVSLLVAGPLAYFGVQSWLSDFAFHVEVSWWVFLLAGGAAVAVAFLTVSLQSVKAALANPVESLRSE